MDAAPSPLPFWMALTSTSATESLRLFPPLDTHRRQCTKATTLRDPSGRARPVTLRPGDIVYLPVDAVHRDPAFYSHPDEFRPEHFDEAEVEKRHKCAFQGFGDGPRQCPGECDRGKGISSQKQCACCGSYGRAHKSIN